MQLDIWERSSPNGAVVVSYVIKGARSVSRSQ